MNIRDMSKLLTSKTLNETLAKKFGTKINVESFTLEQLQDARNKMRTKQFDIETNESFSGLSQNRTYSKNKLFLDVLNAAISERSDIAETQSAAQKAAFQKMLAKKKVRSQQLTILKTRSQKTVRCQWMTMAHQVISQTTSQHSLKRKMNQNI